jgi:hypothetical protein
MRTAAQCGRGELLAARRQGIGFWQSLIFYHEPAFTKLLCTSLRVLAEPIGTRRMDHITLFDARVEKTFSLGPGRRVAAFADVFNLLNANPEQNRNWSSVAFQYPIAIVPPRIARIGVKLAW